MSIENHKGSETLGITRVQLFELDPGPLPVPFQDATMGPFTHWKLKWLRLTAEDGTWGEAPGYIPSACREALLQQDPASPTEWETRIFWMLRNQGHRCPATSSTVFGIGLACSDILAKRSGVPLHRFLGATRDHVPVYASGGGTSLNREQLIKQMRGYVEQGFLTLKMKVAAHFGRQLEDDAERVKAVREAVGTGVRIAVDANQALDMEEALAFAEGIAPLKIAWFEEPLMAADRDRLKTVSENSPVPVACGESENHWLGFRDLSACGVPHLQPCPVSLPGIQRWNESLQWARVPGREWSAGGLTPITALMMATQPDGLVEYLEPIMGHLLTCFARGPEISNGWIAFSDHPGNPLEVDWAGLREREGVKVQADDRAG